MANAKSREGNTYRHKATDAIVLCIRTRFLSHGTARHTLLVLDKANSTYPDGAQTDADETPARVWDRDWEEV